MWYNFAMLNKEAIIQTLHDHQTEIRRFGVRRLGLFGSFARGEQKISSDLDFVVELVPKTFDAYMGLKNFLEELFSWTPSNLASRHKSCGKWSMPRDYRVYLDDILEAASRI